jgi:hypothetical protein
VGVAVRPIGGVASRKNAGRGRGSECKEGDLR